MIVPSNNVCLPPSNDLALLKLDKSPIMTDSVGVACLPEAGEILPPGTDCYISGWGNLYSKVAAFVPLLVDGCSRRRREASGPSPQWMICVSFGSALPLSPRADAR